MARDRTVVALFERREDAHRAITKLIEGGIRPERIGYLEPVDEKHMKDPAKGAAQGVVVGATSGAVIGGLIAAVSVALIPGIGAALVGGALLPVVIGAVEGGAAGGSMGGLLGSEIDSEEELYFMQEVQAGRILVSAEIEGEEAEVEALLANSGALETDRLGTATLHARLHHPPNAGAK